MPWKSREDKLPPPSFFTLIAAYLQSAYKGVRISRELMTTLRPFFIEEWRNGKSAEAAAQSTCSCNGQQIVPSPVIGVRIAKGSVRPPLGAQRGEVFGSDELRSPIAIERLERRLKAATDKSKKQTALVERSTAKVERSRIETAKARALQQYQKAQSRNEQLLGEAQDIGRQIHALRTELNRAASHAVASTPGSRSSAQSDSPPPATPSASESLAKSRTRKSSAASIPKAPRVAPAAAPPGAAAPQSDAMLQAIRGLMPQMATQLAAQMERDGGKK